MTPPFTEACAYGKPSAKFVPLTASIGETSYCGDNLVLDGETCDDGNTLTEGCAYGQTECQVCAADCTLQEFGEASYCGDNIVLDGEACDDGNLEINDGCNDICQIEDGFNCDANGCVPICGDNLRLTMENNGGTEINDGCNDICQVEDGFNCDAEGCTPICGDNLQVNGEACDDGNTFTESCIYGQTECQVCAADCAAYI